MGRRQCYVLYAFSQWRSDTTSGENFWRNRVFSARNYNNAVNGVTNFIDSGVGFFKSLFGGSPKTQAQPIATPQFSNYQSTTGWQNTGFSNNANSGLSYALHPLEQRGADYLVYNGTEIIWFDGKGKVIDRFPATSGLPGYQNSSMQNTPNAGPIPEGNYNTNLSLDTNRTVAINASTGETLPGMGIQKIPSTYTTNSGNTYSYPGWGTIRARLTPSSETNTFGRSNFYLHNSHKGYSHGCIEVGKGFFPKLINYAQTHSSIKIIVNYPTPNTSTLGKTYY